LVLMMERQILDYVLVPSGLALMVSYHIWLLYQILNHPTRTVVGINAINRGFWVRAMMEEAPKNGVLAVQTLRNNIMASTVLASTAITLSSIIGLLMSNIGGSERSTVGLQIHIATPRRRRYGETSSRFRVGAVWAGDNGGVSHLASLPDRQVPHQDRRRPQRHQPALLGPRHDGGDTQERDSGSADVEKQHNGINPFGVDGHHAQLAHRRPDDQQRRWQRTLVATGLW
ncbi:hypothetical protein RJ640_028343, partial [Escallonia rubra]